MAFGRGFVRSSVSFVEIGIGLRSYLEKMPLRETKLA